MIVSPNGVVLFVVIVETLSLFVSHPDACEALLKVLPPCCTVALMNVCAVRPYGCSVLIVGWVVGFWWAVDT